MRARLPEERSWPWLGTLRPVLPRLFRRSRFARAFLAGTALALALPFGGAAQAQTAGASLTIVPLNPDGFCGGISGDGTTVYDCDETWRNGTVERVPLLAPSFDYLIATNRDGTIFGGSDDNSAFDERRGFIWSRATGQQYLDVGPLEPVVSVNGVSSDGRFFAVTSIERPVGARPGFHDCNGNVQCTFKVYRYSQAGGYESIGQIGVRPAGNGTWGMFASGMSGDGNAITGDLAFEPGFGTSYIGQPFLWRSGSGLNLLPFLSDTPLADVANGIPSRRFAAATGISRDGSTVIGQSADALNRYQAVYWRNGTVTGLGFIPGTSAADFGPLPAYYYGGRALAVNADGSIIVGYQDKGLDRLAWRWTAATGMQDLNQIVRDAGLSLNGFVLQAAAGISDNGAIIIGQADNGDSFQGFILQLAQVTRSQLIVQVRLAGVTLTSTVNQSFNTEVAGTLNGTTVFTRSFADRIDTAAGTAAFADARAALGVSALRRITIGAPTLISNTTTVTGTTGSTVDVVSGTQVTTTTVNASGPTTVITGDRGICATAAAANTNPTGCSLAGTPVAVPDGILNSNIFTNTIQSITPTTSQTVNQLIAAKWRIAAVGGNQFGTVHALVGPAAFERGDRLIEQLIDLGGAGGSSPVTRAAVGGSGLTMFGGYFGNWASIDADARVPVASVRGNTNGFVLGLEKTLGDARIGVAVDHGTSSYDVRDATYPEALSLRHTQVGLFANWKSGGFALDGAAAYGFGTVRTTLTTPTTPATATRDVRSWSLGAQAGYGYDIDSTRITLVAGVRHSSVKLNPFTETGGPTPLVGLARTVKRTRVYGGIHVATRFDLGSVTITPRVHARAASDSGDANGVADVVFASAPNAAPLQAVGPGVGRTVAELGGGLALQLSGTVWLWATYDGSFRSGAQSHSARGGLTVAF